MAGEAPKKTLFWTGVATLVEPGNGRSTLTRYTTGIFQTSSLCSWRLLALLPSRQLPILVCTCFERVKSGGLDLTSPHGSPWPLHRRGKGPLRGS